MIKVVKLLPTEVKRFKAIRLRSLKENPEAFGTTFETANTWEESNWISQLEKLNTFIASLNNVDVGIVRSAKDEQAPKNAWIISMWVAPEARGKKVASKLLHSVVEWAKNENVERLKLSVVDSNRAAISLYENHGFTANGNTCTFPAPRAHITEHERELKL